MPSLHVRLTEEQRAELTRAGAIAEQGTPPLVYSTKRADEDARRLLPAGVVLEREVACAIGRGDVTASQTGGFVFLDHLGVVARCIRLPGRLRPRPRSWTIVALTRQRGER